LITAHAALKVYYSTAFSSFHRQSATVLTSDPYLCITEDNGAAVNNCGFTVNLLFSLPITDVTEGSKHTVTVQDYWQGTDSFSCYPYAYTGTESSSTIGAAMTFTGPSQSQSSSVKLASGEVTIQVICWEVPSSDGVAFITWH